MTCFLLIMCRSLTSYKNWEDSPGVDPMKIICIQYFFQNISFQILTWFNTGKAADLIAA